MSSIDYEVRRAEQIALAVASVPNLRASEAKEMWSKQQQQNSSSSSTYDDAIDNDNDLVISTSMHTPRKEALRRRRSTSVPRGTRKRLDSSDEEVRRACGMAVSVAAPRGNRRRLDSSDEEVRRAREMALAVAALGTEKEAMKAEDIRTAIADVISDPKENSRENKYRTTPKGSKKELAGKAGGFTNPSSSEKQKQQQQQQQQKCRASVAGEANDNENTITSNPYDVNTFMEEMLRPPWILRNQSLFAIVALANILILYVTLSSAPSFTKFSNAVFIFNTAISFFCVVEKRDPQNLTTLVDSAIESQTNADATDAETETTCSIDEEDSRKKQEALVDEMEKRIRPKKSITLEWLPDVRYSEEDLQSLLDLQPESTLAERRRFLKARKGVIKAASAQLGSYLLWRSQNKIDEFFPSTFTTDEENWELAARGAMEIRNIGRTSPANQKILPRIVSVYGGDDGLVLCKNGARIVHVLPSQLDTTIAPATTYALALAMYLDRKLDRTHTEKVTVVIDIRSGKGWPNPSSVSLVPFIKLVVGSLNSYFPERLSRCIMFPLPMTATVIFNKAKAYLDPDTAAKIQVCSGAGSVYSAVPSKVKNFIDEESVAIMERRRIASFIPPEGEVTTMKRIPWNSIPA